METLVYDQAIFSVMAAEVSIATASAQTSGLGTGGSPAADVTMESTGTINDYTFDTALVLDTGSGEPVHYKFAKNSRMWTRIALTRRPQACARICASWSITSAKAATSCSIKSRLCSKRHAKQRY